VAHHVVDFGHDGQAGSADRGREISWERDLIATSLLSDRAAWREYSSRRSSGTSRHAGMKRAGSSRLDASKLDLSMPDRSRRAWPV
jgi:hypothetical protein